MTNGNIDHADALFLLFLWIAAFASVSAAVVLRARGARWVCSLSYPPRFWRQPQPLAGSLIALNHYRNPAGERKLSWASVPNDP